MQSQTAQASVESIMRAGLQALGNGSPLIARAQFERAARMAPEEPSTHFLHAVAASHLQEYRSAMEALDRALALEPRYFQALILKADIYVAQNNRRAAASHYMIAVQAAPPDELMTDDLRASLARAQQFCDETAKSFASAIATEVGDKQLDSPDSARFRESVDILLGRKARYVQAPRYYFFPGLPQRPFYANDLFPWLADLEAQTDAIRSELVKLLVDQQTHFKPYVQGNANRPQRDYEGMLNNADWSAFYLWKDGELQKENAARCPNTMKAIASIPLVHTPNRSPSVLFSLLRPGAHIPPHCGLINTRLIGHLPIMVSGKCTFRVGNDERDWVEGKSWIFDDTFEHEARNHSDKTRVILIFEVWQPALSWQERANVNALFRAIDNESGEKPAWDI
jgi:aspartate beta-hydroxylase